MSFDLSEQIRSNNNVFQVKREIVTPTCINPVMYTNKNFSHAVVIFCPLTRMVGVITSSENLINAVIGLIKNNSAF